MPSALADVPLALADMMPVLLLTMLPLTAAPEMLMPNARAVAPEALAEMVPLLLISTPTELDPKPMAPT